MFSGSVVCLEKFAFCIRMRYIPNAPTIIDMEPTIPATRPAIAPPDSPDELAVDDGVAVAVADKEDVLVTSV
jgi:hypothetical protein